MTGAAVMSMEVVLDGLNGEDDVLDEVTMSHPVVDEFSTTIRAGLQPTTLHDIDGPGLLPA